jgi:DNA polymerase-3 subunit delta'
MVDTADELSKEAANALLKTLEEPPDRALLMLIANSPGKLLPTIRSRCQRLDLRPLTEDVLAAELTQHLPRMVEPDRIALAKLAGGSLGAALALSDEDTLAVAKDAARAVEQAAAPNVTALLALGDRIGRSADKLASFGDFLIVALEQRILARAHKEGATGMRRWIEAWEQVRANFERGVGLHLEPRQTIVSSVRAVQSLSRSPR